MKIIVIGDVHGRTTWRNILELESDYDKVVFLGDYFDSFNKTINEQEKEFNDIMNLDDNKTIRLLGNHDYHYMVDGCCYSGFNKSTKFLIQKKLQDLFLQNKIQLIHIYEDIIMSHAGISKYWLDNVSNIHDVNEINNKTLDLHTLNHNSILGYNGYGDTISNSFIWIRPKSLESNCIDNYRQIVGHTDMGKPVNFDNKIFYNDSLDSDNYIIIQDNKIIIKKLCSE